MSESAPAHDCAERVIGIIDLGSNSARLLLVRVLPSGSTTVVNRVKHMVRLGENSFQKKQLQEPAMHRTLQVLRAFAAMCEAYGAEEVLAIATAAVRDAENGRDFIQRVQEKTGLVFTIISGMEEARLIYLGVSSGLALSLGQRLFIDIGGGSTELAVANSVDHESLDSLKLGCVRLTNRFLEGHDGAVPAALFEEICRHVRRTAAHAIIRVQQSDIVETVGSSGTTQALHVLAYRLKHGTAPLPEQDILSRKDLRLAAEHLCSLNAEQRRNLPGVSKQRAEVLVAGAAILLTLLEELGRDSLRVSTRNLQDGILVDYLRRNKADSQMATNLRKHSILQLAQSCHFEESHAQHITRLVLQLHDSAVDCGLIPLDQPSRELLYYAALLHDIGIFISFARHAEHSHYLIRNTELLGFNDNEIETIALLTCFHSKPPARKDPLLALSSPEQRNWLRIFSLFLALGENMDRLHCQHVHEAEFRRDKKLSLHVIATANCPVEQEAVEGMRKLLQKILGEDIRIDFTVAL